ncbi:DUF4767 domain-containing protein [Vagococcus silagei]|uniref:DUF4767 domain-containing protein n=1 Tax=Vagococcus silagei TaxID=2508885 RepID=A0A4S3B422_9ENTE|nr:DUF4767 domain-containing protein [Vagococcus silagei]THB60343.1 DUF4767 domain-containing protein [Vagococcus silagei]
MKKILLVLSMMVVLVGCTKNETYEQTMLEAKEAIFERKFPQAEELIEVAIKESKKDDTAKYIQKQLKLYQSGLKNVEGNKKDIAQGEFEEVIATTNGSPQLIIFAQEDLKKITDEKKNSEEAKKEVTQDKKADENSLWNEHKDTELANYMVTWGQTMNQQYQQYSNQKNVDLYGVQVPENVLKGEWTMAVDESPVTVEWSQDGTGTKDYQLVAVFSDADTQPYMEKHVYFFVIHQGTPQVLITQQNQGNDHNYLYFHVTSRTDLISAFTEIVKSQADESAQ